MTRRKFLPLLLQNTGSLPISVGFTPPDLKVPEISEGAPRPGARVRIGSTDLYHVLYLPEDWQPGRRYPVIVEYPGNGAGPLALRIPGAETGGGSPRDTKLGYGISGGRGFLWLSLPLVDPQEDRIVTSWWGDLRASVEYCHRTVVSVCSEFGGDSARILLCGFSRGSIACNYIGLHDDLVAGLWRAFVCHSHYDGVHRWPYPNSDTTSALTRLMRLKGRPQFISHENSGDAHGILYRPHSRPQYVGSVQETRQFIEAAKVQGDFTFETLPYPDHTDAWILRPILLRDKLRRWVRTILA